MDLPNLEAVVAAPKCRSMASNIRWEIRHKLSRNTRKPLTDLQIKYKRAQLVAYQKRRIQAGVMSFRAINAQVLDSLLECNGHASSTELDQSDVSREYAVAEELIPDSLYIKENPRLPGEIKIGRSNNPEERAKQLSAGQNFRIVVKRSYGEKGFLEKTLHHKLQRRRVEHGPGVEWFNVSVDQADILVRAAIVEDDLSKL